MTPLLDIRNRAKGHWNWISFTRHVRIIGKYKQCLQHLRAIDELCVPAFIGPDEVGDGVGVIDPMFD